jgi:hypothetical protein
MYRILLLSLFFSIFGFANSATLNGVIYDANSMNQLWPEKVERGRFFFQQ